MTTLHDLSVRLAVGAALAGMLSPAMAAPGGAGHVHDIGEPAGVTPATRTIEIELGDSFYRPATVEVRAGEAIRFILTNTGELLHEFNIGTAAMHADHRKEMQAMTDAGMLTATAVVTDPTKMDHGKMGHGSGHAMGHGMMKHDDPNSVLVGPREKKELVWKFPSRTQLEFACNVPGHYEAGMVGEVEFRN